MEGKRSKKPLSSASEIMSRHEKKKRKWYQSLLRGDPKPKRTFEKDLDMSDKCVSRSLENIGNLNLTVIGIPEKAASVSNLIQDSDKYSVSSLSSFEGDSLDSYTHQKVKQPIKSPIVRQSSTHSSDSETSLDTYPIWQDFSQSDIRYEDSGGVETKGNNSNNSSDKESGFTSLFYSYLPLSWRGTPQSSMDSVNSHSDEKKALMQLVHDSDSDQETTPGHGTSLRRHALMQHPFHQLEVWLQEGCDLVIRDSCGTSDPYVKFKVGNKQLYRSRTVQKNLNPRWDERFVLSIEDVFRPVLMKVYDYDRGVADDAMGSAEIDLTALDPNIPKNLELRLSEKGKPAEYMGYIRLQVTLIPKSQEEKEQYFKRTVKLTDKESAARKLKMQVWTGVVTIVLVDGKDLIPMDDNGLSDPYVKFRLGNEKYKSKHKSKTLNPIWLEQFDLRMYQGQTNHLEIMLYDHDVGRDDFMGRAVIDLSKLEREKTHTLNQSLEDGAGTLKLLLTISGTSGTETISDLATYTFNPQDRNELVDKYGALKSFSNLKDVGWLQVKVFKAQGLIAADIGGKSDPFCVLELVNTRLQTHTEYKTLNPAWNKVFTFNVKDIHSVLEVTVFDEDRDKKVEFLGKVAIPLLKIHPGERRWYALKDKKLLHRSKGSIQLELDFIFNHLKAAIRTVNPREEKYMQPEPKFKISVMKKNIDRVTQLISTFLEGGRFIQSCFEWESPARSITAFIVFLVIVWNFEVYMLPITLLILFMKSLFVNSILTIYSTSTSREPDEDEYEEEEDDDDEEGDRDKAKRKEEKKSFKEKLQAAQEICLQVQEGLDVVASLGERVKNTFAWSVPWLSTLAVVALTLGAIILYYIPVRYLIMAWGINKFTKKLRAPNAIPNNELLDFLSRVPSDSEQGQYRELRPDITTTSSRKKR